MSDDVGIFAGYNYFEANNAFEGTFYVDAADTPAGFYLDLGAGGNWLKGVDTEVRDLDFDTGYYAGGTAGYKLDNGLKFEFEACRAT
ncbi:MAG: hypothetical protein U1F24_08275 [Alphaproteobacteria bacterium]